jgi:(5-formylfuran-3-yl)methyl phosphate synthase
MELPKPRHPVSLLASVTDEREALTCVSLGADIIDAKNPAAGALGALAAERVRGIRAAVPAHVPVSATIGDPSDDPERAVQSAGLMAVTGVDFVKIGFWPDAEAAGTIRALGCLSLKGARFVAVLLADRDIDLKLIVPLADAGFAGVMLDTYDKRAGALPNIVSASGLREFVGAVRANGMLAGLAGSLRVEHVPLLLTLGPDVLGFRGGLCFRAARTATIDPAAVRAVRRACGPAPRGAIAPRQTERAL